MPCEPSTHFQTDRVQVVARFPLQQEHQGRSGLWSSQESSWNPREGKGKEIEKGGSEQRGEKGRFAEGRRRKKDRREREGEERQIRGEAMDLLESMVLLRKRRKRDRCWLKDWFRERDKSNSDLTWTAFLFAQYSVVFSAQCTVVFQCSVLRLQH